MFTRKDYVIDGKCTHQQYYAQFVTGEIKMIVVLNFGLDTLKEAYQEDKTFNTIALERWDLLGIFLNVPIMHDKFEQHQDFISQASIVCVLKEAARQLVA